MFSAQWTPEGDVYKCEKKPPDLEQPDLLPDESCRLTNTNGIIHPDMRDPDCKDFKKLKPYDSGYVRVFDPTGKISVYANPDGSVSFEKESNVKGGTVKSGGTVTPNDDGTVSYKPGTSSYEHGATTGVSNPNSGGNTGPQGDAKPDGDGFDCKKASNCDWSKEGTQKQILESANKALDVQKDILKELKGQDLSGDKAAVEQKGKSGTNGLSDQQSDFFNQLKTQSLDIGPYSFGMNSFGGIQQTACQPIKWDFQGQSAELNICNIVDLVRLLLGFILYILTIARLINIFTGTENKEQAA